MSIVIDSGIHNPSKNTMLFYPGKALHLIFYQYEEDMNKLNDIKGKPRYKLIMEIAQESKQIRDLKTENLELKACLDEHQTALELIMNKYRDQMRQFMMTKKLEDSILKVLEANNVSSNLRLFIIVWDRWKVLGTFLSHWLTGSSDFMANLILSFNYAVWA